MVARHRRREELGSGDGSADRPPQHEASTQDLGPPLHLSTTGHRRFRSGSGDQGPGFPSRVLWCPCLFPAEESSSAPMAFLAAPYRAHHAVHPCRGPRLGSAGSPGATVARNCQSATRDGDKSLRIARLASQHEPRPSPCDLGSIYRLFGPTAPHRPSSGSL